MTKDFTFDPWFFHETKDPNRELISLNCITIFSVNFEEDLLNFDQTVVSLVLQENTRLNEMEFLSVVYGFNDLLTKQVPNDRIILATRKLFAIGFFFNQIIKINQESMFLKEINYILKIIIQHNQKYPALLQVFLSAIAYILQKMQLRVRTLDLNSKEGSEFIKIAKSAIKVYKLFAPTNEGSVPYFHAFLLSMILSFNEKTVLNPSLVSILTEMLKITSEVIKIPENLAVNYIALFERLMWFLTVPDENLPKEAKVLIFVFASKIPIRFQHATSFIFEEENIERISSFVKNFLSDFDFKGIKRKEIKNQENISVKELEAGEVLNGTFKDGFEISEEAENVANSTDVSLPQVFNVFLSNPMLNIVLNALANLVKFDDERITDVFNGIYNKFSGNETFEEAVFLSMFIRSLANIDQEAYIEKFKKGNIIKRLADFAFIQFDDEELTQFICDLVIYITKQGEMDFSYVVTLYTLLEEQLIKLESPLMAAAKICKCALLDSMRCFPVLKNNFIEQRIANLLFLLQNIHALALEEGDEEKIKRVEEARKTILMVVKVLLDDPVFARYLFDSQFFVEAILQLSRETSLVEYSQKCLTKALSVLNAKDATLLVIYNNFLETTKRAKNEEKLLIFARNEVTVVINAAKFNSFTIATVFFSREYINTLISLTIHTKDDEDMYRLLKLAQKCVEMKGTYKELFIDFNLYTKIIPAVEEIVKASGKDKLLNHLWSLAFQASMNPDEVHPIKNGEPLSLIFHLYRDDENELINFVNYLMKCIEEDTHSTLEVTNSSFPNCLISYLSEFRSSEQTSKIFDEVSKLFAFLSQYFISNNDMLTLLRSMTSLPNGKRPFYSNSFLMSLLLIFQSPFDAPSSFFNFSGKNSCLVVPPLKLNETVDEFTFFIDLELINSKSLGKLFFFDCPETKSSFGVNIRENELEMTVKKGSISESYDFDFIIPNKSWTNIILTFDGSKIRLYLHGRLKTTIQVPQITLEDSLMNSVIAHNIKCNVGACGLLRKCLDEKSVHEFTTIPRNVQMSFDPSEKANFSSEYSEFFTNEMAKSTILILSAGASKNEQAANIAPYANHDVIKIINGTTFGYYPRPYEVISAIGGPSALIPLFAQLDMPVAGSEEFDSGFLPVLLKVLISYLSESETNQQKFANMECFKMIASLIGRASPKHVTVQVVELFRQIYSIITYPKLFLSIISDIFLDVRMWMYTDIKVHKYVYKTLLDCYERTSDDLKQYFYEAAPANKIINIIKTCYWTSPQNSSLLVKPRIFKHSDGTQEEIQRPENLAEVREELWKLTERVFVDSFSQSYTNSLLFFATDKRDIPLTFEGLRFMVSLVRNKDEAFVKRIAKHISFDSFFHLLLKPEESLHILCLHIFVMFTTLEKSLRDIFLAPFNYEEWIEAIVAVINGENDGVQFADNIYGYLFGLFSNTEGVLNIELSKQPQEDYILKDPTLISLAVMAVSHFEDSVSSNYLYALDNAISKKPGCLSKIPNTDTSFLSFLITHCPDVNTDLDKSCEYALSILAKLYAHSEQFKLDKMVMFYENLGDKMQRDFSHLTRAVLKSTLEYCSNQEVSSVPDKVILDIISVAFTYMFAIPESSIFFKPFSIKEIEKTKPSFQELTLIKMGHDFNKQQYTYATRSTAEGEWFDAPLADVFLQACEGLSSHFTSKQIIFGNTKPLFFMFSFVLSTGLSHKLHYYTFERHVRPLTNQFPTEGNLSSIQRTAFVNYFAGLTKVYMQTDRNHVSHIYMQEDSNAFATIIKNLYGLKRRVQWGTSIDSFDGCFKSRGHHFAHMILQEFSKHEDEMTSFVKDFERTAPKILASVVSSYEKSADNYKKLNDLAKSESVAIKNKQAEAQLLQFASQMRVQMSQGVKLYKDTIHDLSVENGPWRSPESNKPIHWKLFNSLQTSYRRGRLVENTDYVDHKDASLLRDVGNVGDAQELYRQHLLQSKITTLSGEENFEFEENEVLDKNYEKEPESQSNILIRTDASLITMKKSHNGTVTLTKDYLFFESNEHKKYVKINLTSITDILLRHYLLMDTAIEVFTTLKKSLFFDFPDGKRKTFIDKIKRRKLPQKPFIQQTPSDIQPLIKKATEQWSEGKLTNFDYLMKLNIYSGRSYNDLSQYPVFPWVLSNYTSDVLDLNDPKNYRDLGCPIGALDKDRLDIMKERVAAADTEDMRYLYGSFYSSAAVVIGFLIRMEPFASLHIELQSGRFDISDRLFHSIPRAWDSVNHTSMDFRELIPEFFYLPDFLKNDNGFDLGSSAPPPTGDVGLPPWANSPSDFIIKNRAALESKYVSDNLPKWIDLIFGVTSRGKPAIEVNNVYSPNFFSEVINQKTMKDNDALIFAKEFAACFGEAPQKIFDNYHPMKKEALSEIQQNHNYTLVCEHENSIVALEAGKTITAISSTLEVLKINAKGNTDILQIPRNTVFGTLPFVSIKNDNILFASPWDRAFSLAYSSAFVELTKREHMAHITAVSMGTNFFATGGADTSLFIWSKDSMTSPQALVPVHNAPITCIGVNDDADLCIGCSRDGYITATSLIGGKTYHAIQTTRGEPKFVSVFDSGAFCVAFTKNGRSSICVYDQNMNALNSLDIYDEITSICSFERRDGYEYIFVAQKCSSLSIIRIIDMSIVFHEPKMDLNITTSTYNSEKDEILIGTECGKVIVTPLH